jgi:hypothetical protein
MNRAVPVAVLAACLLVAGCHHDTLAPQTMTVQLRHDGANVNAPNLVAASYEAAARFTSAQTGAVAGGSLTEVEFYLAFAPASVAVKIYGPGTATSPGSLLYSADVTAGATPNDWNRHTLQTPLAVPAGDLWIAVAFTHPTTQKTIGCDAGPAQTDGDWLYASTDGTWTPFNQRFAISINWNIRGTVEITQ